MSTNLAGVTMLELMSPYTLLLQNSIFLLVYWRLTTNMRKYTLKMGSKNKLLVFDLDYTLWPFFVDTHVDPPFRKNDKGDIVDTSGRKIKHYPEVPKMLQTLHDEGYTLGVASRTSEIKGANQLLQLFDWDKYFSYKEIYPGCKVTHFNNFRKDSKMEYKDMIFFDDERRNIVDISKLGVTSILVNNGMTMALMKEGLEQHAKQEH